MSNTKNSPACADKPPRARRPFDGVMISLSAALLVIFGIVIGRFVVTARSVDVVDHFDGEISTLRAELIDLNRQLLHAQARAAAMEESSDNLRQLATTQQVRADRLVLQQQTMHAVLSGLIGQRDACLGEVQKYLALNKPVPATDVLRFAEAMFDAQSQALDQLSDSSLTTGEIKVSRLPSFAAADPAASRTKHGTPTASPVPNVVQTGGASPRPLGGVFFAPSAKHRKPESCQFFTPQHAKKLLTVRQRSGVTFHDSAAADDGVVRR